MTLGDFLECFDHRKYLTIQISYRASGEKIYCGTALELPVQYRACRVVPLSVKLFESTMRIEVDQEKIL